MSLLIDGKKTKLKVGDLVVFDKVGTMYFTRPSSTGLMTFHDRDDKIFIGPVNSMLVAGMIADTHGFGTEIMRWDDSDVAVVRFIEE